ncbi:MAG: LptF/LptG family permease [Desulfovibrionaceae bacterium]
MLRPNLLQRVLFKEMASTFLITITLMVFILILLQGRRMEGVFIGINITFVDVFILLLLVLPYLLTFIFPIAVMISIFLTFFRMNTDKESTALRASGISLYHFIPATLFFATITFFVSLWLSLYALPEGAKTFSQTIASLASLRAKIAITPGIFYKDLPNIVLFTESMDGTSERMKGIFLEQKEDTNTIITITADEGIFLVNPKERVLTMTLHNGNVYRVEEKNFVKSSFVQYTLVLPLDNFIKEMPKESLSSDAMTLGMISDTIKEYKAQLFEEKNEELEQKIRLLQLERHNRFIFPVACIVLALFTIPIATAQQNMNKQIALLFLLFAFLIYYLWIPYLLFLIKQNIVPTYTIWLPNIVYLLMAIRGIYLVAQERQTPLLVVIRLVHSFIMKVGKKASV